MLKHFELLKAMTNNATQTVAINPDQVIAVYETKIPVRGNPENDEDPDEIVNNIRTTVVVIPNGQQFNLEDSYLDVVARLNEQ